MQNSSSTLMQARCCGCRPGLGRPFLMLISSKGCKVRVEKARAVLRTWPPPSRWLPSIFIMHTRRGARYIIIITRAAAGELLAIKKGQSLNTLQKKQTGRNKLQKRREKSRRLVMDESTTDKRPARKAERRLHDQVCSL